MVKCVSTVGLGGRGRALDTFTFDSHFGAVTICGWANAPTPEDRKHQETVERQQSPEEQERRETQRRLAYQRKKLRLAARGLTTNGRKRMTKQEKKAVFRRLAQKRKAG